MGFILDQSSSINRAGDRFENVILKFVKDAANRYGISKDGVHAGVLVFSDKDKTKVKIHFDKCINTKCFTEAVENMVYDGGNTFTNEALKLAGKELFNEKRGYRQNVQSYAILIADGGQTGPRFGGWAGLKKLEDEARSASRSLRERGITVVVFGIGVKPSARNFLESLASPGEYHDVVTFSDLQGFLDNLLIKICLLGKKSYLDQLLIVSVISVFTCSLQITIATAPLGFSLFLILIWANNKNFNDNINSLYSYPVYCQRDCGSHTASR